MKGSGMLTVEERHDLVQAFERCAWAGKMDARGLDGALRKAIATETAARVFYETLNAVTDWGIVAAPRRAAM
jgi:hypothetical protein